MERWLLFIALTLSVRAQATPSVFVYEGYLTDSIGTPITGAKDLKFDIYGDSCRLGQFTKSGVAVVDGRFSVVVGDSGSWTSFGSAADLSGAVTGSSLTGSASCAFSETAASRRYVQVTVCDAGFVGCEAQGSLEMTPSPNALRSKKSDDAASLGGVAAANYLLQTDVQTFAKTSLPACAAGEVLKANGVNLSCVTDGGLSSLNGLTTGGQTLAIGFAGTTPGWSSAGSTHTLNIPMASTTAAAAGLLSKTDYDAFTAKLDKAGGALTGFITLHANPSSGMHAATKQYVDAAISGGGPPTGAASGDLGGTYPGPSVTKIQGRAVSSTVPFANQVLVYNGSDWAPTNFGVQNLKTSVGATQFSDANCAASQTLNWSAVTDAFSCVNISGLSATAVTSGVFPVARLPVGSAASTVAAGNDSRFPAGTCSGANKMRWDGSAWQCEPQLWVPAGSDISYAAGMVGIGTSTPAEKLHVYGGTTQRLLVETTGAADAVVKLMAPGKFWEIDLDGNGNGGGSTNALHMMEDGISRFVIAPGGNVGIGTASPASKLTVNGTLEAANLKVTGGGTPPPGRVLMSDSSGNAVWGTADLGRTLQIQAQGNSNLLSVIGSTGSILTGGTAAAYDSTTLGPTAGVRYYSSTSGTIVGAAGPVFTYPAWSPLMDAMITMDSPLTSQMAWVGLSDSTGVGACSSESNCVDNPTTSKVLAFRYSTSAGDSAWQCVTCGGVACTIVSSGVVVSALTNYRMRIELDSAGAVAKFWINGVSVCGSVTTNLPSGSGYMAPHATVKVLVGASRALIVNRMSVRTN